MIKNSTVTELLSEFARKRNRAVFLADAYRDKAYNIPSFEALNKKVRDLNFEIGQAKFLKKSYADLEKQLKHIQEQEEDILNSYGLSLKLLQPHYECSICNDMGTYKNEYCSCFKQALSNKLMMAANIDINEIPLLSEYDYSIFPQEEQEYLKKLLPILKEYVNDFTFNKKKNWLFIGGTGTGKTYLAKCVAKEFIVRSYTTLFISAFNLNKKFLTAYLTGEEEHATILEDLIDLDLLIIDDLGVEPMKNKVTKEYLLLLLNERMAKNKATIVTTNLRPDELMERYGERIASRLLNKETCVTCRFENSDLRTKRKTA